MKTLVIASTRRRRRRRLISKLLKQGWSLRLGPKAEASRFDRR
jgi:hypothetical protein